MMFWPKARTPRRVPVPLPLNKIEKGNFVGSVAHSSSLLVALDLHRHNLVALTDTTLIVFPADRMASFFQANPGVLVCLLDAEFVL